MGLRGCLMTFVAFWLVRNEFSVCVCQRIYLMVTETLGQVQKINEWLLRGITMLKSS